MSFTPQRPAVNFQKINCNSGWITSTTCDGLLTWAHGNWDRWILENEIGEWVFYVYWYWSDTHTLDLCRWMSSQHVGIKAVSCGALGVVLQFVDFEALCVDSHGDLICFCSPCCFLDRFMMVNTSWDGCFSMFLDCEGWQYESVYRKEIDRLEQKNMW